MPLTSSKGHELNQTLSFGFRVYDNDINADVNSAARQEEMIRPAAAVTSEFRQTVATQGRYQRLQTVCIQRLISAGLLSSTAYTGTHSGGGMPYRKFFCHHEGTLCLPGAFILQIYNQNWAQVFPAFFLLFFFSNSLLFFLPVSPPFFIF